MTFALNMMYFVTLRVSIELWRFPSTIITVSIIALK